VSAFDPRIVSARRVALVKAIQRCAACRLGGGAALAGIHLHHRLSRDVDIFFEHEATLRDVVRLLPDLAAATATSLVVARDARSHVRVNADASGDTFEVDLVYDPIAPIEPPARTAEDVVVESYVDLRASKLACLVERSEPRDLVDVLFLERAGHRVEDERRAVTRLGAC